MNNFEKQYYENSSFWTLDALDDDNNKERIIQTANLIPKDVKTLADIGCGNGIFLKHLKDNNPDIETIGVDRSESALSFYEGQKTIGDIALLPFKDNAFDCVTCLEVIEHLPVPVYITALKELCRISKKYVIISVPFQEKIENSYTKCPSCLSMFNHELHLRRYEKADMNSLLIKFDFKSLSMQTLGTSWSYYGHELYSRIFYPKNKNKWCSPICPICGFNESPSKIVNNNNVQRSWISVISVLPKLFWPKKYRHYWIMSLYEKV